MRQVNPVFMAQLQQDYIAAKQIGSPLLQCQGMLVPRGAEHMRLLIQNFPRPLATNNDPANVDFGGGLQTHVPGTPKTNYQGSLTVLETETGATTAFSEFILANGGEIDCDYYDGRVDSFTRSYEMLGCAITLEQPDMGADGRSQVVTVSGSIEYNYFGLFANIGTSGTVFAGQRNLRGADSFLNRVQEVLNVAQAGVSLANQAIGLGGAIRGLLG